MGKKARHKEKARQQEIQPEVPKEGLFRRLTNKYGLLGLTAAAVSILTFFIAPLNLIDFKQKALTLPLFSLNSSDIPKFRGMRPPTLDDLKPSLHPDSVYNIENFLKSKSKSQNLKENGVRCLDAAIEHEKDIDNKTKSLLYTAKGAFFLEEQKVQESISVLEQSLALDPENIYSLCYLRYACQKLLTNLIDTTSSGQSDLSKKFITIKNLNEKIRDLQDRIDRLSRVYTSSDILINQLNSKLSSSSPQGSSPNGSSRRLSSSQYRLMSVAIDYSGSFDKLDFAVSDARKLSAALAEHGFATNFLANDQASKLKILQSLVYESLVSEPNDTFVFYFAGHGFTDMYNNRFILTYSEILSLSDIEAALRTHKGNIFVILDTCFDKHYIDSIKYDAGSKNSIAFDETYVGTNRPIFLLASSLGEQSIESNKLGSGLYTYTLLEYLANQERNRRIDFIKLFNYASKRTLFLSQKMYGISQKPMLDQAILVRGNSINLLNDND